MLVNSMRSSIRIPQFRFEHLWEMCSKSIPTTFPICLAIQHSFAAIWTSKNRLEISPKLVQIYLSATKPYGVPLNASKHAPEVSTSAPRSVQQRPMMPPKASKMLPKSIKGLKIIRRCTLVYRLQRTSHQSVHFYSSASTLVYRLQRTSHHNALFYPFTKKNT